MIDLLKKKSLFVKAVREFFENNGFWEVTTPYIRKYPNLDPNVVPIKTEIGYLHTSPEYAMKKLLALGADDIYQICKVFRKETEDDLHKCEFLMLEWYKKDKDYSWLIEFSHELLLELSGRWNKKSLSFKGRSAVLNHGYEILSLERLFCDIFGISLRDIQGEKIFDLAKSLGFSVKNYSWEETFFLLYVDRIEPVISSFSKPVYVVDFPSKLSVMAKTREDKPWLCERVELIISGVEIMNGYSELTDSYAQWKIFKENFGDEKVIDVELLRMLDRIGVAAGASIGLDRLFMLFEGSSSIQKVCPDL